MALKLKTPPATDPVTLAEAKLWCRVDVSDDDSLITGLIKASVAYIDGWTGILKRCLITQTWELYFDAFPSNDLQIPLGGLLSVDLVEYVDPVTLVYTTWPATNYETDLISTEGWIIPKDSWPPIADTTNAVRITFKAGYGAATEVPQAIKTAMGMMISDWYDGRSGTEDIPIAAYSLLAPYRRVSV